MFCNVERFAVMWYHKSTLISQGAERILQDDRITIGPNFTLTISNVGSNDQGQYRCTVHPTTVSIKATLTLFGAPKPVAHKHIINTIVGADAAELRCAYKSPNADVLTWRRNGTALDVNNASKYALHADHKNSNGQFISNLTIKKVAVADLGEYVCEVLNDVGTGSVSVQLVETPEPPKYVTTEFGEGVVSSHWTVHSHQPLIEVQLNYRQDGVSWLVN